ncbi:hypothetical protein N9D57_02145 [bacterium]|nr:hypothetical protein [bacterium]MDA9787521.1 hypothetical protein [bacterium]
MPRQHLQKKEDKSAARMNATRDDTKRTSFDKKTNNKMHAQK